MKKTGILTAICLCILFPACKAGNRPDAVPKTRIVSLAPSLTEIVFAVGAGDRLVGRTSACDYPASVTNVPVVGGFGMPSIEKLISINPSVVLEVDMDDKSLSKKFQDMGVKMEHVRCDRIADIPSAIRQIGGIAGESANAETIASTIEQKIQQYKQQALTITNRPKVFVEIWNDPVMTAGKESFVSELVYLAGGTNIGDQVSTPYYKISEEWVLAQNPDVIICLYMGSNIAASDCVKQRAGWNSLNAVINDRIYDRIQNDVVLRPGPRVLAGIEQLEKAIKGSETLKSK